MEQSSTAAPRRLLGRDSGSPPSEVAPKEPARRGRRGHGSSRRYGERVTPEDFKKHGYELIDWIADYVENIEQQRVTSTVQPGDVRAQLDEHPPTTPDGFDAVMADTERVVVPGLDPLAAPQLLRVLPRQLVVPGDPRAIC